MQLQLDRAKDHLRLSAEAQGEGDFKQARVHLLHAARYMLEAAQRTDLVPVQAQRYDYARQFQERADALLPRIEAQQRARAAHTSPATEPNEGSDAAAWLVAERPDVRFDDVAGLDDVKQQIRLKIIYPFTHPQEAAHFGVRSGGGILLYGPPGTGKTLIAKAVAGELEAAFFTVKPSEVMSKWVGEAEQNVGALFKAAREHERAVIFLDEVEALVPKRRGSNSTVMQRVVPQFLGELDGMGGRHPGLLLIGATNEPWLLDAAVLRPGRFDEKIYVPLPDLAARQRILELNLSGRPLAPEVNLPELAQRLEGYSGADIAHICQRACEIPFLEAVTQGTQREVQVTDFVAVMEVVRSSVSSQELRRYVAFATEGT